MTRGFRAFGRPAWLCGPSGARSVRFVRLAPARVCTYRAHVRGLDVDADERARGETFPPVALKLHRYCSAAALQPPIRRMTQETPHRACL
jgi:hypothetical protein